MDLSHESTMNDPSTHILLVLDCSKSLAGMDGASCRPYMSIMTSSMKVALRSCVRARLEVSGNERKVRPTASYVTVLIQTDQHIQTKFSQPALEGVLRGEKKRLHHGHKRRRDLELHCHVEYGMDSLRCSVNFDWAGTGRLKRRITPPMLPSFTGTSENVSVLPPCTFPLIIAYRLTEYTVEALLSLIEACLREVTLQSASSQRSSNLLQVRHSWLHHSGNSGLQQERGPLGNDFVFYAVLWYGMTLIDRVEQFLGSHLKHSVWYFTDAVLTYPRPPRAAAGRNGFPDVVELLVQRQIPFFAFPCSEPSGRREGADESLRLLDRILMNKLASLWDGGKRGVAKDGFPNALACVAHRCVLPGVSVPVLHPWCSICQGEICSCRTPRGDDEKVADDPGRQSLLEALHAPVNRTGRSYSLWSNAVPSSASVQVDRRLLRRAYRSGGEFTSPSTLGLVPAFHTLFYLSSLTCGYVFPNSLLSEACLHQPVLRVPCTDGNALQLSVFQYLLNRIRLVPDRKCRPCLDSSLVDHLAAAASSVLPSTGSLICSMQPCGDSNEKARLPDFLAGFPTSSWVLVPFAAPFAPLGLPPILVMPSLLPHSLFLSVIEEPVGGVVEKPGGCSPVQASGFKVTGQSASHDGLDGFLHRFEKTERGLSSENDGGLSTFNGMGMLNRVFSRPGTGSSVAGCLGQDVAEPSHELFFPPCFSRSRFPPPPQLPKRLGPCANGSTRWRDFPGSSPRDTLPRSSSAPAVGGLAMSGFGRSGSALSLSSFSGHSTSDRIDSCVKRTFSRLWVGGYTFIVSIKDFTTVGAFVARILRVKHSSGFVFPLHGVSHRGTMVYRLFYPVSFDSTVEYRLEVNNDGLLRMDMFFASEYASVCGWASSVGSLKRLDTSATIDEDESDDHLSPLGATGDGLQSLNVADLSGGIPRMAKILALPTRLRSSFYSAVVTTLVRSVVLDRVLLGLCEVSYLSIPSQYHPPNVAQSGLVVGWGGSGARGRSVRERLFTASQRDGKHISRDSDDRSSHAGILYKPQRWFFDRWLSYFRSILVAGIYFRQEASVATHPLRELLRTVADHEVTVIVDPYQLGLQWSEGPLVSQRVFGSQWFQKVTFKLMAHCDLYSYTSVHDLSSYLFFFGVGNGLRSDSDEHYLLVIHAVASAGAYPDADKQVANPMPCVLITGFFMSASSLHVPHATQCPYPSLAPNGHPIVLQSSTPHQWFGNFVKGHLLGPIYNQRAFQWNYSVPGLASYLEVVSSTMPRHWMRFVGRRIAPMTPAPGVIPVMNFGLSFLCDNIASSNWGTSQVREGPGIPYLWAPKTALGPPVLPLFAAPVTLSLLVALHRAAGFIPLDGKSAAAMGKWMCPPVLRQRHTESEVWLGLPPHHGQRCWVYVRISAKVFYKFFSSIRRNEDRMRHELEKVSSPGSETESKRHLSGVTGGPPRKLLMRSHRVVSSYYFEYLPALEEQIAQSSSSRRLGTSGMRHALSVLFRLFSKYMVLSRSIVGGHMLNPVSSFHRTLAFLCSLLYGSVPIMSIQKLSHLVSLLRSVHMAYGYSLKTREPSKRCRCVDVVPSGNSDMLCPVFALIYRTVVQRVQRRVCLLPARGDVLHGPWLIMMRASPLPPRVRNGGSALVAGGFCVQQVLCSKPLSNVAPCKSTEAGDTTSATRSSMRCVRSTSTVAPPPSVVMTPAVIRMNRKTAGIYRRVLARIMFFLAAAFSQEQLTFRAENWWEVTDEAADDSSPFSSLLYRELSMVRKALSKNCERSSAVFAVDDACGGQSHSQWSFWVERVDHSADEHPSLDLEHVGLIYRYLYHALYQIRVLRLPRGHLGSMVYIYACRPRNLVCVGSGVKVQRTKDNPFARSQPVAYLDGPVPIDGMVDSRLHNSDVVGWEWELRRGRGDTVRKPHAITGEVRTLYSVQHMYCMWLTRHLQMRNTLPSSESGGHAEASGLESKSQVSGFENAGQTPPNVSLRFLTAHIAWLIGCNDGDATCFVCQRSAKDVSNSVICGHCQANYGNPQRLSPWTSLAVVWVYILFRSVDDWLNIAQ